MTQSVSQQEWLIMRSNVYLRDKGICWVCSSFVDLVDYDLGHLIDRCMDGSDTYDNLAVMHKSCNLSKPKHKTLEEAVKWQLTATINNIRPIVSSVNNPRHFERHGRQGLASEAAGLEESVNPQVHPIIIYKIPKEKRQVLANYEILREESTNQDLIDKIKPATVCWIQGYPQYKGQHRSPMWRLLPPPYKKEDAFTMRQTPPGAKETSSKRLVDTMQILNGILTQEVNIKVGIIEYHIQPNNTDKPIITITNNRVNSNTGERWQTIGLGVGQIPIDEWRIAKSMGVSLEQFKEQYLAGHVPAAPVAKLRLL